MKTEAKLFLFMVVFFTIVTPIYVFMTWGDHGNYPEPIGTTVLILTLLFCAMIWGLLALTGRSTGPRPEDRKDGEIIEGAGALGFFPPTSIIPFWSTIAIAIMLLGAVFGWWLTLLGAGLGIYAALGWAYEYYVGDYQH
ncbi:cytochrome c oxidase subunit 4 [Propioniciclava sinopodophylli]|uniref:Cytochrome c oxidase polypeptide 4 n=1 Tax=Propioniciclava sinopodophylli TaxID=1837344 RepID=A0A4Q9KG05_9ACTN|nr:cytochrome c oxidase subunit 4 [Propioniciclava sinopodophylli]TBT87324.1 cytochrome c oxidase subunit 4 [Propioniciclava sinopodophylli]